MYVFNFFLPAGKYALLSTLTNRSKPLKVCSIDPGIGGAVAFIDPIIATLTIHDMPTLKEGKRTVIDTRQLGQLIRDDQPTDVVLEHVQYVAGDGAMGAFSFGDTFGSVKGVIGALDLPLTLVRPQVWKRALGLIGMSKEASFGLALNLFPAAAQILKGPRGGLKIDRAEALLLGHWFMLTGHAGSYSRRGLRDPSPASSPKKPARARSTARRNSSAPASNARSSRPARKGVRKRQSVAASP